MRQKLFPLLALSGFKGHYTTSPSSKSTADISPAFLSLSDTNITSAFMDNQLGDTEIHMLIDEAIPSDAKRPTNISHIVDDKVQATMDAVWEVSISSRWPKRCSD